RRRVGPLRRLIHDSAGGLRDEPGRHRRGAERPVLQGGRSLWIPGIAPALGVLALGQTEASPAAHGDGAWRGGAGGPGGSGGPLRRGRFGRVKAPITYYGGKSGMASWIASLLPPHRTYMEPFFGSGAVLFCKRPAVHEIVNDLDGNVVTFFRRLRERPVEVEVVCRVPPYAREECEAV